MPNSFSVQGVLRDNAGKLQSMMVNVQVTLFDAQTGGNAVAGPFGPTAAMAQNGLFTLTIEDANLRTELAGAPQVWMEVAIGTDTFARQAVTPQLFALRCGDAEKAELATKASVADSATKATVADSAMSIPGLNSVGGKIGIGTATPLQLLDVESGGGNGAQAKFGETYLQSYLGEGHLSAGGSFDSAGTWTAYQTAAADIIVNQSSGETGTGNIVFFTDAGLIAGAGFNPTARMIIAANGNVGIGTTAPESPLDVRNSVLDGSGVRIGGTAMNPIIGSAQTGGELDLVAGPPDGRGASPNQMGGTLRLGDSRRGDADLNVVQFLQNGVERMRIHNGGKVGIGTASPLDQLHVNGDARVSNCLKNSAGTGIAGTCPSDARFKKDIVPLTGALDQVSRLQPVTYEWRRAEFPERHFGPGRMAGLIAQDVEKVAPQLVSTDEQGFKSVSYGAPVEMLMLQAVRELHAQNVAVREENRALRARLERIERRLEQQAAR